jgi:hypothetical protein
MLTHLCPVLIALLAQVPGANEGVFASGLPLPEPPDQATVARTLNAVASSDKETREFLDGTEMLLSYCCRALETRELTPQVLQIREVLVKRGLNYESIRTRSHIAGSVDLLLFDRPLEQLPLLRDALNDPHDAVRGAAATRLGEWVEYARGSQNRGRWEPATRKALEPQIIVRIDEIADLLIWKGLTDEEIWAAASTALTSIDASPPRIRSLRRALDAGVIRDPGALRVAREMLAIWDPAFAAKLKAEVKPARDPFAFPPAGADPFGGAPAPRRPDPFGGAPAPASAKDSPRHAPGED